MKNENVVSENVHTSPPCRTEIPRGGWGPKGDNFRGWGLAYRGFFPGGLSEIGELLTNNSFSVEQAISYFTVTGVSKQVLLFPLIIFYPRSAKCFSQHSREFSLTELSSAHGRVPAKPSCNMF